ncbi:hypothetical protein A0J61_06793 [Choanephora cucurbitarum]|uniref:F-box domain-containing protein n=1 Tax=Choanephora cucurbitarum TaxID=101091 RepID=A0A1C7N948_9FUNG|nr:hypothetical protein A0J61_06793 [Choanephora cucurbitarum]
MIRNLPTEVLQIIGSYLSFREHIQLVLVNRQFYQSYVKFVFQSVKISAKDELHQFMDQTKKHRHVRHLSIFVSQIDSGEMERLAQLFPRLSSVRLRAYTCDKSTLSSCQSFRNLHSLTLLSLPEQMNPLTDLFLPRQLKNLTIYVAGRCDLGSDLLECIHSACPFLDSLSVKCREPSEVIIRQQMQTVNVLRQLELTFSSNSGPGDLSKWFSYFGRCYPNLQALYLLNEIKTNDWNLINAQDEHDYVVPCRQFLSGCPLLTYIEFKNISLNQVCYRQLKEKKSICLANIFSSHGSAENFLQECGMYLVNFSAIRKLEFYYAASFKNPLQTIASACPNLTQLVLRNYRWGEPRDANIDTILKRFRYLERLDLIMVIVTIERNDLEGLNRRSYPLQAISIKNCMLSQAILDYISTHCIELKHLHLDGTTFKHSPYYGRINLKQQRLASVNIKNFRILKTDELIQFFRIQSQTHSEWYCIDMDQKQDKTIRLDKRDAQYLDTVFRRVHSTRRDLLIATYEPTSDLADKMQLSKVLSVGYLEIICHSIGALHINNKYVYFKQ